MPKILLVEDEQALRETLMFLLESEGYEVIEAEDGAAAITQFEKHGADLILLDLMLPKLSGKEVCKQI
ncbi:MAG: response regulator, partial [Microbacteriaceae bacterium]|nr:response regulator [Microbacteriaceae bacterium]